jgi:hypothetical protein
MIQARGLKSAGAEGQKREVLHLPLLHSCSNLDLSPRARGITFHADVPCSSEVHELLCKIVQALTICTRCYSAEEDVGHDSVSSGVSGTAAGFMRNTYA